MKENKSRKLAFRVTEKLYNRIKSETKLANTTLSKWMVQTLESHLEKESHTKPKTTKEIEASNPKFIPTIIVCLALLFVFIIGKAIRKYIL